MPPRHTEQGITRQPVILHYQLHPIGFKAAARGWKL